MAMKDDFHSLKFSFCFCDHESNLVAHRLVKWAFRSACDEIWFGRCPTLISDVVLMTLYF